MSSHFRHCPKHRKPLPCPHCALVAKSAPVAVADPEPLPDEPAASPAPTMPTHSMTDLTADPIAMPEPAPSKKKKPGSIRIRKKWQQDSGAARGIDGEKSWTGSSHVITPERTSNTKRVKRTPAWVNNDQMVHKLVRQVFPELKIHKKQQKQAALWFQIIRLWFCLGWAEGRVVEEINRNRTSKGKITVKQLHDTIYRIRRAARDHLPESSAGPSGTEKFRSNVRVTRSQCDPTPR